MVMEIPYFHNHFIPLYNLVTSDGRKCFTEEISRIITFTDMFHMKHDSCGLQHLITHCIS